MTSQHPYAPYIPEGANRLLIGTMPPYRFCVTPKALFPEDVDFYYGSRNNFFWRLLSQTTGTPLARENTEEAVEERQALLRKLRLGVTDVIDRCTHAHGRSDDLSLKEIVPKPVGALLVAHPGITGLIYTSRFVIRQMNAFADTHRHAWDSPQQGHVAVGGKRYAVTVLYSPSPSALRSVSYERRARQYAEVFGRTS